MAQFKDLTGQVFGRWTVLDRAANRLMAKKMHVIWRCQCQCGTIREVMGRALKNGQSKSCGCYMVECVKARTRKDGTAFRNVMRGCIRGAQDRGLDFQLSETQFRLLTTEMCYYCGQAPAKIHVTKGTKEEFRHGGIDRLDPTIGYLMDNCVPCCSQCNYMKQDFSEEEFVSKCKEIARRHAEA